ncbi:MAG TPA: ACT domain-containing protein [Ideonella sp.]|uniref:ACT domain-containing protein n=1 Tax=Ideonella sp. TaxID=1929293 RepID=UPI002BCBDAFB|nr:ACT domain-containing protein [Ideonella sp.]HSI51861.1 ACT domain-containing protein [Ideonella sp.]
MNAVRDLHDLCREMTPSIADGVFVFCTFSDFRLPQGIDPICTFREAEGLTAIIDKSQAEAASVRYTFPCRLITLTVHSSLDAVGFLACITDRLAHAGIACNAVAAFHHDHLFVPEARAAETMEVLRQLSANANLS